MITNENVKQKYLKNLVIFVGILLISMISYKIIVDKKTGGSNVFSNIQVEDTEDTEEMSDPPYDLEPSVQLSVYKEEDKALEEAGMSPQSLVRQSAVAETTSVFDCDDYIETMKTALAGTNKEIKTVIEVNQSGTNTCSIFALYEKTNDGFKLMSHEFTFSPSTSGYTISNKTTDDNILYGHYSTSKSLILISIRSTSTSTDAPYTYVQFWAVPNGKMVSDYSTTGIYNLDSFFSSADIVDATNHIYKVYKTNKYLLIPIPANFHIVIKPSTNGLYVDTLDFYNIPSSNVAFPIVSFKNSLRRLDTMSDYSTAPFKYTCQKLIFTPLSTQKITLTGASVYAWNGAEATISNAFYGTGSSTTTTLDLTKLKANTLEFKSPTAGSILTIELSAAVKIGRVILLGVGTTLDGGTIDVLYYSSGWKTSLSSTINEGPTEDRVIDPSQERLLKVSSGNLLWTDKYYKASPFLEPFVINDFDKMINSPRF